MTEPPETTRDSAPRRRRVLIVGLVLVAAGAALIAAISAGQRDTDSRASVADEIPTESTGDPTATTTEQAAGQPTETSPDTPPEATTYQTTALAGDPREDLPTTVTQEPPATEVAADLEAVLQSLTTGLDTEAIARLSQSDDLRVAWVFADLMRFIAPVRSGLSTAFTALTGVELGANPWLEATNKLIEWDTPPLPGFGEWKGRMYTLIEPGWAPFFADEDSLIDWRHVTWGGGAHR